MTNEELLNRLFKEAEQLNFEGIQQLYPHSIELPPHQPLQPGLPFKKHYQLIDLMQFDGDALIHNTYRALMQRNPDPQGLAHWQAQRAQGLSKIDFILALKASAEAIAQGVTLTGIERIERLKNSRLARYWPQLVGWLVRRHERKLNQRAYQPLAAIWDTQINQLQQQQEQQQQALQQLFYLPTSQLRLLANRVQHLEYQLDLKSGVFSSSSATSSQDTSQSDVQANTSKALDAFYLAFEQACRSSQQALEQHLQQYLTYLPPANQAGKLVDIGCGRGEWLQLVKAQGYQAIGIEINPVMQDFCQQQGLQVELTSFLQWLQAQPSASLGAITAFQVAEHLPFELLFALVQEAKRTLQPGGLLLLETPNPENLLVASHTFYHDPTHRHPLTPTLMRFLAEYVGFVSPEILRSNPYPQEALLSGEDATTQRINGHFCGPQDFALLAIQPDLTHQVSQI